MTKTPPAVLNIPPDVHAFAGSNPDPAVTSARGFLWWLLREQWGYLSLNVVAGLAWIVPWALTPYLLGNVIDRGLVAGNLGVTLGWATVLLVVVAFGVLGGISMHTTAVLGWIQAIYRTKLLVARKAVQLGHVLPRRTPTGEVMSVASSDSDTFGALFEVTGRAIASVVAYVVVALIVLAESWKLGLIVLVAAPLMVSITGPLMKPFQSAQNIERTRSSRLTGMATDIVAGLRILRGIGGERTFGDNYARQSQSVRKAGVAAGTWFAGVDALGTLLSGLLLVALTYLGAVDMVEGRLRVGQLVSFFGYAIFLVIPMQTFFEFVFKWISGAVSAEKTRVVLGEPVPWCSDASGQLPPDAEIVDLVSGFIARPRELTMVVSVQPDETAALADRLGRYLPAAVDASVADDEKLKGRAAKRARADKIAARARLAAADAVRATGRWGVEVGGVDLSEVPLDEVRKRIFVSDTSAMVFAGTLRQALDPHGVATRERTEVALRAASAEDVYDGLPGGWQGQLDERGRGLSGGQRQRVILARALVADPDILVLVEPTSAVDAHTEARIAERLAEARRGRTTIVVTSSPLLLRHADRVAMLVDGVVVATGAHAELFETNAEYRQVVRRGMGDDE